MAELEGHHVSEESKLRMQDILRRFEDQDEIECDSEDDDVDDKEIEEEIQRVLEGLNVSSDGMYIYISII